MNKIPLFDRPAQFGARAAIFENGESLRYDWLETRSRIRARQLLGDRADLEEARIGFLMDPGFEYVVTQWAIWRAGGIAVPLCPDHPEAELAYVIDDADVEMLLASRGFHSKLHPLAEARGLPYRRVAARGYEVFPILPLLADDERARAVEADDATELPPVSMDRRAMILYTSGTTGRPKGVVTTHANIDAHMRALLEAWEWTADDRILHVLPLHHTHGIVNALCCALYAGGSVEFAGAFDAGGTWDRLASSEVTVFMAVPTIYAQLLRAWEEADEFTRARWSKGVGALRLMVSGSAALPVTLFRRWEEITGHRLLERYGMTEIGMGLSNPFFGERRAGTVGQPLPGVELRIVDSDSRAVLAEDVHAVGEGTTGEGTAGEILVRGPMVFSEYWRRPEETAEAFDNGWFRTGDVAVLEDGYYRILGRGSVDILKSGGYKISAVEIEEVLRTHVDVRDCAVVGLPDEEWGERVAVALVLESGAECGGHPEAVETVLGPWVRERLAPYKVPRLWLCVQALPRNAMGKVQKSDVQALF